MEILFGGHNRTKQGNYLNLKLWHLRKLKGFSLTAPFLKLHMMTNFGPRAADNQLKTIGRRKTDKEGHSADAMADALYSVVLGICFRRRGEKQLDSVRQLISVFEGRGGE